MLNNILDGIPAVKTPALSLAGAVLGAVLSLFGGWDMPLRALLLLNLGDLASGILKGFLTQTLSSASCRKGAARKLFMWLLVGVAVQVDHMHGQGPYVREAVVWFWVATEAVSITENAAAAGLPVPPVLTQALEKLRGVSEVRLETNGGGKPEGGA